MRGRLTSIRIENFKAIGATGSISLKPLTVFIGNNGSGKSSVIEALQTLQRLVTDGLDRAMQVFKGMEHVRRKGVISRSATTGRFNEGIARHALEFRLRGRVS